MTLLRLFAAAALAVSAAAAQPAAPPPPPPPQPEVKSYTLPAEKRAKAIEYARERNRLYFFGFAWGMAVIGGVLALRLAPKFRDWAERVTRIRFLQAYIFVPLLLLVLDLADLPFSVRYHHLAVKYEQSVQPWGSWFWDWTKGELISFAISGFLVWGLYGLIRRSPRRWWLYGWLATVPLVVFLVFIEPVVLAPVFNKFEPLAQRNAGLVTEIGKVTARGGLDIPRDRMFLMLASEKVNSLNAYVTGVGASKRVVVWDTTIAKTEYGADSLRVRPRDGTLCPRPFVDGDGRCVYGDSGVPVCLVPSAAPRIGKVGARMGHAVIGGLGFPAGPDSHDERVHIHQQPGVSAYSRMLEHDADIYGLEVIHGVVPDSSRVAAESFQILGEVGLSDPDPSPFVEFWMYDHPSIRDRVRFASQYDPWGKGEPPKYVR